MLLSPPLEVLRLLKLLILLKALSRMVWLPFGPITSPSTQGLILFRLGASSGSSLGDR